MRAEYMQNTSRIQAEYKQNTSRHYHHHQEQECPQIHPQIAPNTPKLHVKMHQKCIQNPLEINPRGPKGPQDTPRGKMSANWHQKGAPKDSQMDPKWHQKRKFFDVLF